MANIRSIQETRKRETVYFRGSRHDIKKCREKNNILTIQTKEYYYCTAAAVHFG